MSTADSDGSGLFHRRSDGWFGCGFCIYVECGEEYSDAELMKHLGISGYSPLPPEDSPDQPDDSDLFVQIASDGRWTHISDDDYYTLWNDGMFMSGNLRDRIVKLARLHNIFTHVLGEADDSFEFEYFEGSKLRRRYVVEDPYFDKDRCIVAQDYGGALPGEEELSEEVNMDEKIRRIEDALGIETDLGKLSIRTYTKPYREPPIRNWLMILLWSPILIILFILSPIEKIDLERIGGRIERIGRRIDWLLKATVGVLVTYFVLLLFLDYFGG